MNPTITWTAITAAWGILLGGAFGVMKTADAVRGWAEKHLSFTLPSYVWIIVPFGVGVVTCITSQLNPLTTLYPPLAHVYGEVLSGIVIGSIASPLHHGTAWLSAKSKAVATATVPPSIDADAVAAQAEALALGSDEVPAEPGAPATPPDGSAG